MRSAHISRARDLSPVSFVHRQFSGGFRKAVENSRGEERVNTQPSVGRRSQRRTVPQCSYDTGKGINNNADGKIHQRGEGLMDFYSLEPPTIPIRPSQGRHQSVRPVNANPPDSQSVNPHRLDPCVTSHPAAGSSGKLSGAADDGDAW